ncbi:MAG TPA: hypothetical protein VGJ90_05310 [Methylophilaceae bacterium]
MTSGALTVLFIAHWFTKEQQGYFYTFGSVLGLQVIFEMGLSFVIFQFSGHLFAGLNWLPNGDVQGDDHAKLRFHLLLRSAFVWYACAALIMLLILLPAGILFFQNKSVLASSLWLWPWVLLVVVTALNLVTLPTMSAIEGSGRVTEINKLRLIQGVVGSTVAWFLLVSRLGLWMVVAVPLVTLLSSVYWLYKRYPSIVEVLITPITSAADSAFSWKAEVWPMQWKIAVSWICGYFIFQLFTPILFHFYGPVAAGKMGMSIAVATMVNSLGFVLLQANGPTLTKFAAQKKWIEFDHYFFRFFKQSLVLVILGYCFIGVFLYTFQRLPITQRIIPFSDMVILCFGFLISHVVSMLAYYLRLHKQEPFMVLSLIGAVILSLCLYEFGRLYAELGMVVSFLCVNLIYGLPSSLWLWAKMRREWH